MGRPEMYVRSAALTYSSSLVAGVTVALMLGYGYRVVGDLNQRIADLNSQASDQFVLNEPMPVHISADDEAKIVEALRKTRIEIMAAIRENEMVQQAAFDAALHEQREALKSAFPHSTILD